MGEKKSLDACRLRCAPSCTVSRPEHLPHAEGSVPLRASAPPSQDRVQLGRGERALEAAVLGHLGKVPPCVLRLVTSHPVCSLRKRTTGLGCWGACQE